MAKRKATKYKKDPKNQHFLKALDPRVRRWLNTPDPDDCEEEEASDQFYDKWLLERMNSNQLLDVGGVLVDRALLDMRFACVPERCSPAVERGKYKSCCADLTVYLVPAERKRLGQYNEILAQHLIKHEPRLMPYLRRKKDRTRRFFLDEDGDALLRPDRCVFSKIDTKGRIRCHLHQMYHKLGIDQTDIQPVTCRLFPLVLVHMPRQKVLVTAINRSNYRAWGGKHPRFFPCLSDDSLPPMLRSMGPTLNWLFGKGFVQAIREEARRT